MTIRLSCITAAWSCRGTSATIYETPSLANPARWHPVKARLSCIIWTANMAPIQYPLSVNSWRAGRNSVVVSCQKSQQIIGSFPLEFVRQSGDDSWEYVLGVLEQLVEPLPAGPVTLMSEDGRDIDMGGRVYGGKFYYRRSGEFAVSPTLNGLAMIIDGK